MPIIKAKESLSSKLSKSKLSTGKTLGKRKSVSVWSGLCSNTNDGGITQSLLSDYVTCPERFRLRVMEGLSTPDQFNHRMEYGQMWHCCEENHASNADWKNGLLLYAKQLCKKYPLQQEQIQHWYKVCLTQFPIYVDYWKKHDKKSKRTPLLQEQSFQVPYIVPEGRVVYLRGKWDSVDQEGKNAIWLQENKSKGDINEQQLQRQLLFDLQTMIYLVALQAASSKLGIRRLSIQGVRYNVIRRPLSGGKGSISKKKGNKKEAPETDEQFYSRLAEVIKEQPEYFFMRWKVAVTQSDIDRFINEFLNPCLENLADDYEWWTFCKEKDESSFNFKLRKEQFNHQLRHYRLPYGIYNPIAEGGSTPLDEYLATGSEVGLRRGVQLFKELQ